MSVSANRAHYDRVTAGWKLLLGDELHYGLFSQPGDDLETATDALTGRVLDACDFREGDLVLDVGCGIGVPACKLAGRMDVEVIGISPSAEGVGRANELAASEGLGDRVTFLQRDGMANEFDAGSFDRAFALESSHLMRRKDQLLAETGRVLRPGGRFVLCDIVLRREMPFTEVRRLREPLALLRDVFGDAHMVPLAEYRGLIESHASMTVDTEVDLTDETRATFSKWRANAQEHGSEAGKRLGGEALEQFVEACSVLERFWDDGTLGYGLIAANRD